jgi:glycerol-3-phosphate dehydrogenase
VVGGGVTGAGAALDAATRGLSVALLERGDLASGTSSRSGKTFHGGLRYLEQLNFSLVRSALRERDLMVERLCPHLVRPEPFLFPLTRRGVERARVGAGVLLYDLLGGARHGIPHHRHLTRRGALRQVPALRPERVVGAVEYHDVRVDDARHTMTVARTAACHGAAILTRVEATGVLREGERVTGVRARDHVTGRDLAVRAGVVVNAAGVWADRVQALAGEPQIVIRAAKGIHVVVPRSRIDARSGLITRAADSVLVVRPWWGHWIVGTTDTAWDGDRDEPVATGADVSWLLAHLNEWLRTPVEREHVVGVYAGLRPLLEGRGQTTAALRRDHAVLESVPGLVTVAGGKYTTYRAMAADAVDAAVRRLARPVPASCTAEVPLLGADGWPALRNRRAALAREARLAPEWVEHLLGRYGALLPEILDLIAERPELARPLAHADGYLEAELVHAATHEGALTLEDALERRTHIVMEAPDRGVAAAARAAELVGEALGWDDERRMAEAERHRERVAADRRAEGESTDAAALAARRAPEPVHG